MSRPAPLNFQTKQSIMRRPWFKFAIASVFGSLVALSCIAEAVILRGMLPW